MIGSGAFCFGVVIGFVTYRTLTHTKTTGISDIASVIGAVGGATIVALFPTAGGSFDYYAIGLAIGFFFYFLVFQFVAWKKGPDKANQFLGKIE
jgi:uncharacterized membrane protein YgaE (UPF0421/DUF939 family)